MRGVIGIAVYTFYYLKLFSKRSDPQGPSCGGKPPRRNILTRKCLIRTWGRRRRSCKVSLDSQYTHFIMPNFFLSDPTPGGQVMGENPLRTKNALYGLVWGLEGLAWCHWTRNTHIILPMFNMGAIWPPGAKLGENRCSCGLGVPYLRNGASESVGCYIQK